MENLREIFYKRLNDGPALLLLGQDYLKIESGYDLFLNEILNANSDINRERHYYDELFGLNLNTKLEKSLEMLNNISDRIGVPKWLEIVSEYQWNNVYTSAIDTIWTKAFKKEYRKLSKIYDEKYYPIDPRNRTDLHCTFLFGCVDRTGDLEYPPLSKRELIKKHQKSISFITRLPEIITPFGTLVIEGYEGERDWLKPEDIYPVIDELGTGQVYIFSATENMKKNEYLKELVDCNKLILISESLSSYLRKGLDLGYINTKNSINVDINHKQIQINNQFKSLPISIYNRVSKSSIIIDDSMLIRSGKVSIETKYRDFRNFLSQSSLISLWEGYKSGFAFQREFEKELYQKIEIKLNTNTLQKDPIILYGQTGTGKTIALGNIAYKIKKEGKYPVIFIERKSHRPNFNELDAFCKWAEDNGANTTLIIWDGMAELEQYNTLLRNLVSGGRKIVLVGSIYNNGIRAKGDFICAPAQMMELEVSCFLEFLKSIDDKLSNIFSSKDIKGTEFLVALYRLLPASRVKIKEGITQEFDCAEKELDRMVKKGDVIPEFNNLLSIALWNAGLISSDNIFTVGLTNNEKDGSLFSEVLGYIMVPGRFGLQVPLELLIRTLGKEYIENFIQFINTVDIFRWNEDKMGNISIGPRHSLEAKLYVQSRLRGPSLEVKYAKELISNIKDDSEVYDGIEIQFAVDLLKSIGSNGETGDYFLDFFEVLSNMLRELHEKRSISNPRLMLQEANLLREYVVKKSKYGNAPKLSIELLNKAEDTLKYALIVLDTDERNKYFKSKILVELASILGTKATHILNSNSENKESAFAVFSNARDLFFKARSLEPENYLPIDIMSWLTQNFLESNSLDKKTRFEVEVDIMHIFDLGEDYEFTSQQQEAFLTRKMTIMNIIGKEEFSDDAFKLLDDSGSSAGYYLKAVKMAGDISKKNIEYNFDGIQKAIDFLRSNLLRVSNDGRCLSLLMRLFWLSKVKKPIFYSERETIPFESEDWSYLLKIINIIQSLESGHDNQLLNLLTAIAYFHLKDYNKSIDVFKDIERGSDFKVGRRRVIKSYLASNIDGTPMKFNGTVISVNNNGSKGEVYVEEIRRNIYFLPIDFNQPNIQKNETINNFHIAFNFIGPIADDALRVKVIGEGYNGL